jgi:hypothetical protein
MKSAQEGSVAERRLAEGSLDYSWEGHLSIENCANSVDFLRKGRGSPRMPRVDVRLQNRP